MRATLRLVVVCAVGVLIASSGCAPAYHHYADCNINCRYCPQPPLPYMHYSGCVCHSCAATKHLAIQPPIIDSGANEAHSDTSVEMNPRQ